MPLTEAERENLRRYPLRRGDRIVAVRPDAYYDGYYGTVVQPNVTTWSGSTVSEVSWDQESLGYAGTDLMELRHIRRVRRIVNYAIPARQVPSGTMVRVITAPDPALVGSLTKNRYTTVTRGCLVVRADDGNDPGPGPYIIPGEPIPDPFDPALVVPTLEDLDWRAAHRTWREAGGDHATFIRTLQQHRLDPTEAGRIERCAQCRRTVGLAGEDLRETTDGEVCQTCIDAHVYRACTICDSLTRSRSATTDGQRACTGCLEDNYLYCNNCGVYYPTDGECGGNHPERCRCESPAVEFTVPNGAEPLPNDTRTTVTVPDGLISDEGIEAIRQCLIDHAQAYYLYDRDQWGKYVRTANLMQTAMEPIWQTKAGNFTKRLSRLAYKEERIKLPADLITMVGNVARDHSVGAAYEIETTRLLNMSPDQFANADSCWWQSYAYSRCALKSNGGFSIRSFDERGRVSGRIWVMPLRVAGTPGYDNFFRPVLDAMEPAAFMVFNGYKALSGYAGARVLSAMTGLPYKKVSFAATNMYVNSNSGYLVASQDVLDRAGEHHIGLSLEQHESAHNLQTVNA